MEDCGIACISSILKYYDSYIGSEKLRNLSMTSTNGTTAYHMKETLKKIGINAKVFKCNKNYDDYRNIKLPVIAHTNVENSLYHYIVIYDINDNYITVMDPSIGYKKYTHDVFNKLWTGIVITCDETIDKIVNDKKYNMISFVHKLFKMHKINIIKIVLLSFIFVILNILSTYYFKYIIDESNINNLYNISIIFFSIIIIKIFVDYIRNRVVNYINTKMDMTLFISAINHIIALPYGYYKNRTTGDVVSRINDLSNIRDMINKIAVTLFIDLFILIFAMIFLFYLNKILFLISIVSIILYIIVMLLFNPKLQKLIYRATVEQASITSNIIEVISGYETIKGLHVESEFKSKIHKKYKQYNKSIFDFIKSYNNQNTLKNMIGNLSNFFMLFIGSIMVLDNVITVGELITYYVIFMYFSEPIRNIIDLEQIIRSAYISLKRIVELYEIKEESPDVDHNIVSGNIVFNQLSFAYDKYKNVVQDFSLKIKKGQKVMLLGPSGSGKSTIMKLLMKYYQTNRNQLIIDDIDINDYSSNDIRNSITYSSQNEMLFTDSVYNNIDLYRNYNIDKIDEVSNLVLLDDNISSNNYNMQLEENGSNLSGGQRQKIVLARTLLKDSRIIILDESTNHIDTESERIIFNNIISKYTNTTIIVISHRDNNSDLFDQVITLNKKEEEYV